MNIINFFKKYISWHLKNFSKIFDKVLSNRSGQFFAWMFNLSLFFKSTGNYVDYDKSSGAYKIYDSNFSFIFMNEAQGVHSYKHGLLNRSQEIGNVYMLDHIQFHENDLVVDCGANVGDLLLYFWYKKININYFGIEPSPNEYQCLNKNAEGCNTFQIGLWKEEVKKAFYVSSDGADSSLIAPAYFNEKISMQCKRLDQLNFNTSKIKLLKLEAEGAEPEVLMGAENVLRHIEYISADLGPERGSKNEETYHPVTDLLYEANFSLIKINPERPTLLFRNNSLTDL
jgi:FkbM family methyltransferase